MAIVIIIICVLAALHFFLESVIMPSVRIKIRCRLFGLRDRLRNNKIENPDLIPDNLFTELELSLNRSIKFLNAISITNIVSAKVWYESDPELAKQIEAKISKIVDSGIEEVVNINKERNKLMVLATAANSAGLLIYFFPLVYLSKYIKFIRKSLGRLVQKLSFTPENKIDINPTQFFN